MRTRASLGLLVLAFPLSLGLGCTHAGGKIPADTMAYDAKAKTWVPLLPHKAPDIDELTGIETPDAADTTEGSAAPAPQK